MYEGLKSWVHHGLGVDSIGNHCREDVGNNLKQVRTVFISSVVEEEISQAEAVICLGVGPKKTGLVVISDSKNYTPTPAANSIKSTDSVESLDMGEQSKGEPDRVETMLNETTPSSNPVSLHMGSTKAW